MKNYEPEMCEIDDDLDFEDEYENLCDCQDCNCLRVVPEPGMICDECRIGNHFKDSFGVSEVANGED